MIDGIVRIAVLGGLAALCATNSSAQEFTKVGFNNPGLVVDLKVGLWASPFPVDFDGDGDRDLLVATADVPSNGVYFFENPGGSDFPVFRPGKRLFDAKHNIMVSLREDGYDFLMPGRELTNFNESGMDESEDLGLKFEHGFDRARAQQWRYVDFDGDGARDIAIGLGVWDDYGWDDAFNDEGEWVNGPLHGYVYIARNEGTTAAPQWAAPKQLATTAGGPVDTFGAPSPNFADFDGDGDLDLVCGSFLDTLTYFENTGTRTEPAYAPGKTVSHQGDPIHMDLEMLQLVAVDWDKDGAPDLIVGQEDGRVALLRNEGDGASFTQPQFFKQEAEYLNVGALCTPVSTDWDGDGDEDLVVGDTAGYISFVENLDGGNPPKWAAPEYLNAGGETLRILAGPNGSIQGPAEAKWGYTVLSVGDWDHDGLDDIVINSIWGKILWYKNVGEKGAPKLAAAQPVEVAWDGPAKKPAWFWWNPEGDALATQWRTSPYIGDMNGDGLNDLTILDHEGYLALFAREKAADGTLRLLPGKRVYLDTEGNPLQLNERTAGKSGRRKLTFADWDGDGDRDLLINSVNADLYRNVGQDGGAYRFKHEGPISNHKLAGHTTCPTVVDWNGDGVLDLLLGAEDGFFYHLENPRS